MNNFKYLYYIFLGVFVALAIYLFQSFMTIYYTNRQFVYPVVPSFKKQEVTKPIKTKPVPSVSDGHDKG